MDNTLSYFNPRDPGGRRYLANLAVIFSLVAIPTMCLVIPAILFALASICLGIMAGRLIDPVREELSYRRAQAAIFLGFVELLVGTALLLDFISGWAR